MTDINIIRKKSSSVSTPKGASEYVVQTTDTLAGIATKFETTISIVKKMNRLMSDLVFPSQVLLVPNKDDTLLMSPLSSPANNNDGESDSAWVAGHAERSFNVGSRESYSLPRALSGYEVKKLWEKCDERFIKLHVHRILRTQAEPVSGTMIVTPDCVMFDPLSISGRLSECTSEHFPVMLEMRDVLSVAVYHNLTVEAVQSRQLTDLVNSERLHASRLREVAGVNIVNVEKNEDNLDAVSTTEQMLTVDMSANVDNSFPLETVTSSSASSVATTELMPMKLPVTSDNLTNVLTKPTDGLEACLNLIQKKAADCLPDKSITKFETKSDLKAVLAAVETIDDDAASSCETSTSDASPIKPTGIDDELHIYLCIKGLKKNKLVMPGKFNDFDKYWFSVPHDKVDQLFAFFIQWSSNVCNDESLQFADEQGFIVVSNSDDHVFSVDDLPPRQSKLCRSTSFSKDWEIVNVRELALRMQEAEVEQLPLPALSHGSDILEESHLRVFMNHLPARAEGSSWRLVYSTAKHGYSLRTLYRHMIGVDSPVLIVIKDRSGQVFGTMQSCSVKKSDLFYGTGESYLFSFGANFKKYRWTGINSFFTKGNLDSLCFGASGGKNGLWLDGDLFHGRSQCCQTYNNEVLSSSEDFTIECLEAWCFS